MCGYKNPVFPDEVSERALVGKHYWKQLCESKVKCCLLGESSSQFTIWKIHHPLINGWTWTAIWLLQRGLKSECFGFCWWCVVISLGCCAWSAIASLETEVPAVLNAEFCVGSVIHWTELLVSVGICCCRKKTEPVGIDHQTLKRYKMFTISIAWLDSGHRQELKCHSCLQRDERPENSTECLMAFVGAVF